MPQGTYKMERWEIGYKKNDPYTRYMELGMPADLSREAVKELKNLSSGQPKVKEEIKVQGVCELELPIQENGVYLVTLTPTNGKQ
jgi:xylan 1,4-beta-xylosidase